MIEDYVLKIKKEDKKVSLVGYVFLKRLLKRGTKMDTVFKILLSGVG